MTASLQGCLLDLVTDYCCVATSFEDKTNFKIRVRTVFGSLSRESGSHEGGS